MRSRSDEIAAFFEEHADRLERLVRARVAAPDATIEDACSYAWCQLVRRVDIHLDDSAAGWLYRVAIHEGWRLSALERATVSYSPGLDDRRALPGVSEPVAPQTVDELVLTRMRVEALRALPDRPLRVLLLFAYGLKYAEIAEHTGDSLRTVDRLLRRAKQLAREVDVDALPAREREALVSIAGGLSVDDTAAKLGVSSETVREYVSSCRRRLGACTRAEALSRCIG